MGQVLIRNLDDDIILRQRRRAKRKGVSLEQHLRDVVSRDAERVTSQEWLGDIEALVGSRVGQGETDSAALVREGRNERDSKWSS